MYVYAIKELLKSKMTTKIRSKLSKNRKRASTSCHEDQEENGSNMKNVKINEDETNNSLGIFTRISNARLECATSVAFFNFNKKRVKVLSEIEDVPEDCEGIVYWMSRDQRVQDNWAFLYAQRTALKCKIPLHVCFCLVPKFLDATIRQYSFLLEGLKEVEQECISLNINFHLLLGEAKNVLPEFIKNHKIGGIICDFSPLRVPQKWIEDVNKATSNIPFCQVDAHNIVPCWIATDKLEYSARTIRNKIHNKLAEFLTEYPPVIYHPFSAEINNEPVDWISAEASLQVDRKVKTVEWAQPGSKTALEKLDEFCQHRLKLFADKRNDPTQNNLSNLSPWIHFGQISVQRCILEVSRYKNKWKQSVDTFTEEAVVRRELADNFCFYNPNYDNILGASEWARRTLNEHKKDKREYLYSKEQFEEGMTHDPLWNAAQLQMVREGKMHGFLRMYWAKKILEWTTSPEEALKLAIYLNDKYELDGRDPNGYVGCMWSICGTHDQGWAERAIFGKIRYMNYAGCKRKFDVDAFINKYPIPKKDKNVKTR